MGALPKIFEAFAAAALAFGPWKLFFLVIFLVASGIFYKIYSTRRMEAGWREALQEKEKSIQRLADECRQWRVVYGIKELGLGQQKSEKIFKRNEFATPEEARGQLEKPARKRGSKGKGRGRRG